MVTKVYVPPVPGESSSEPAGGQQIRMTYPRLLRQAFQDVQRLGQHSRDQAPAQPSPRSDGVLIPEHLGRLMGVTP